MARRGYEQERAVAVAQWHGEEVALEISVSIGGGGLIEMKRERTRSE
jgi:hypothetical protein